MRPSKGNSNNTLGVRDAWKEKIRCWREETESIAKAFAFGHISEQDSTEFEVSIRGTLQHAAIHDLLNPKKPPESDRMTEFFTIHAEGMVSCEHYGKEIYIFNPTDEISHQLSAILTPIKEYYLWGIRDIACLR